MELNIACNNFENELEEITDTKKWKSKELTEMLAIVKHRKKIYSLYKDFLQQKDNLTLSQYMHDFLNIFRLEFDSPNFMDIREDDLLKNLILKKIDDKKIKKMHTSIYIRDGIFAMDEADAEVYNLTLYVLTDEKINPFKRYSKEDVLNLYHGEKILVFKVKTQPSKHEENMGCFYNEFYQSIVPCNCFPKWFEQPIVIEIIKHNKDINNMMQDCVNKFKQENKQLAHVMAKALFMAYEKEKQCVDKCGKTIQEKHQKELEQVLKEHESEVKKWQTEKQNLEFQKTELNNLINEFIKE